MTARTDYIAVQEGYDAMCEEIDSLREEVHTLEGVVTDLTTQLAECEGSQPTPPTPEPEPPTANVETVEQVCYLISGPPLLGTTRRPKVEAPLDDVHPGYNWSHAGITSDGFLAEQGINGWGEIAIAGDAQPVAGCQLQVARYKAVSLLTNGQWREVLSDDKTVTGQMFDARVLPWKVSTMPNSLFRQVADGTIINLDPLLADNVSMLHWWNQHDSPRRRVTPQGAPAPCRLLITGNWMRLVGPQAQRAAAGKWFVGCTTSDKYDLKADGSQAAHKYGVGHPRECLLTDKWQWFGCAALTQHGGAQRAQPDYIAKTVRDNPSWPRNPQPPA